MNSAGLDVDRLQRRKAGRRRHQLARRKRASLRDNGGRAYSLRDRIDSAEPAAGRSRNMSPPLTQMRGFLVRQPHPQFDAVVEIDDLEGDDFFRGSDDPFVEAEADGKILEILRRA